MICIHLDHFSFNHKSDSKTPCLVVSVGVGEAALAAVVSALVCLALDRLDVGRVVDGMLADGAHRLIR